MSGSCLRRMPDFCMLTSLMLPSKVWRTKLKWWLTCTRPHWWSPLSNIQGKLMVLWMSYDSNFKLKVILKAKELGSNHKAADFFRMTEKMIQDWHKKEDQLKTVKKTDKPLKQCGRSIHDRGFDDSIMQWLSDAPDDGHTMTGVTLQLQVWHVSTDHPLTD